MGVNTSDQVPPLAVGDIETPEFNFTGHLRSNPDELIASVTSVTELTTSDLTISNVAVNTAELTILGQVAAIGKAVQCKIVDQVVANSPYKLKVIVVTDSNPPRTMNRYFWFRVSNE